MTNSRPPARRIERLDYLFKTTPYKHQKEAFELSRDKENFALFMEQGTGKTKVAIDSAAWLWDNGKIDALLVVAPNGVHSNWSELELPAHLPDRVPTLSIVWEAEKASTKKFKARFERVLKTNRLAVFAVNVDALATKAGVEAVREFLVARRVFFVLDESTRIKNPSAARTKAAIGLGKRAEYRRILTGTPVTQSPFDLFAQFQFLDEHVLGFSSFFVFKHYFGIFDKKPLKRSVDLDEGVDRADPSKKRLIPGKDYFEKLIQYANLDELKELVAPHSYRVTKEECLDLPPKIYQRIPVKLTKEQERIYRQMSEELVAEIGDELIVAPIVLTKLMRLSQITGGFVPLPDPDDENALARPIGETNPKLEAVVDSLEDFGGKAIIFARFRPEIAAIVSRLRDEFGPEAVVEYTGNAKKLEEAKRVFQDPDSPVRFFVTNTKKGGIGLTLTAASLVVFYSNDFSLETRLQAEDRAHRIGQTKSVTYLDFEAIGTLDEDIITLLREKKNVADYMTGDALKKLIKGTLEQRRRRIDFDD